MRRWGKSSSDRILHEDCLQASGWSLREQDAGLGWPDPAGSSYVLKGVSMPRLRVSWGHLVGLATAGKQEEILDGHSSRSMKVLLRLLATENWCGVMAVNQEVPPA